jgi:gliding motility-associated-like protein
VACGSELTVTFSATDACENTGTATAKIKVIDTANPVVTAPAADLELECDQSADYSTLINDWLATASASDDCDGTLTVSSDFDMNDLSVVCGSELTVTFSATDACENTGTATAKIKVTDTTAPVIVLPQDDLILECYNSDAVDAWIATAMANDNCDGETDVTASYDEPDSNCEQTVTVTFSATDNCGNTATAAKTFTVDDKTGPEFSEIIPFNSECSNETLISDIQVWIESVIATDNCGEVTVSNDFYIETLPANGCGELTVTFTAEDECGNTSVVASTISIEDTKPPVIECNPISVNLRTNGIYILSQNDISNLAGTISDNCTGGEDIIISASPRYFSCIQAGQAVPVTITATDECGNSSECQTTVTVNDNMAPQIACPEDITVSADADACSAIVDFEAEITDNCNYTVTYSHEPGSEFPVGTTEVTVTATDESGNASACSFNITVTDDMAPVVECPEDIVVWLEEGESTAVIDFTAQASDNCDFALDYSHDPGSEFPLGTTNVAVTATDLAGNSTECSFDVTVLDENAPVIICPDDITVSQDEGQCGAVVHFEVSVSDESGVILGYSHDPGSVFPVGTTTVTVTATDESGNSAECSFRVTVTDDEDPFIVCPEDLVVVAEAGECEASVIVPEISELGDNCEFTYTNDFNNSTDASGIYPVGTTEVVWTITDAAGNTATCTMAVTVNAAPVAIDDEASTEQNAPAEIDILANDTDCLNSIDPASVTIPDEAGNGTLAVDAATGIVTYTPASDFAGTDTFTYSVCNAGGLCSEATVAVTVTEVIVNTTVAEDDEYTMLQDTILEADVSVNDYDPEGDNQINFNVLVPPANGTFALFPDGTFEFAPYEGYMGEDYFIYEVCDDGTPVACDTATAYILVEEREADTIIVEPPFQLAFKIPEGFSPNYDGYNDYFVIQHLHEAYPNARPKLEVYNRWGTLLYEQEDYGNTDRWGSGDAWWDGSSNKKWTTGSEKLPPGTYFYILYFNDGSEPIKGSVFLNRNR